MPDHYRTHKTDIGPRSPSGQAASDCPLSLVMDHHHRREQLPRGPSQQHLQAVLNKEPLALPAPAGNADEGSSGFSSDGGADERRPLEEEPSFHAEDAEEERELERRQEPSQEEEEGADLDESKPLALVVEKQPQPQQLHQQQQPQAAAAAVPQHDSGHEESSASSGSGSPHHHLHQQQQQQQQHQQHLLQQEQLHRQLTAARASYPPAPLTEEQPNVILQRKVLPIDPEGRVDIQPNVTIAKVVKQEPAMSPPPRRRPSYATSNNGIKIKDFARVGDNALDVSELPHPQNHELISDVTSEVSSIDTWSSSLISEALLRRASVASEVNGVYPCDFCERAFANKYHLASHLITHTGERGFECRMCDKTFGRRSTLRAHMTTHTKTSNFMCPLCEKACNDNNSLEEHLRAHTGEKPFACGICSKAYARKSHLNVHYRVHTGERPFVCTSCGKDFTEKRFLNDHVQTAHGSGNDGQDSVPLRCPNCYREFAYKTSLKQHLKKQMCVKNLNRHNGNMGGNAAAAAMMAAAAANNVQAMVSPAVAPNGAAAAAHTKQFQCPFCEKSYSWKQTLKQHVSMYHRNKVHTDEFWKYELAKHRRSGLDTQTNEDMWARQLGKHADEFNGSIDGSTNSHSVTAVAPAQQQVATAASEQHMSPEMKLLALQSLQFMAKMSNGDEQEQEKTHTPVPELIPVAPQQTQQQQPQPPTPKKEDYQAKDSYMTFLAQFRQRNQQTESPEVIVPPQALSPPSTVAALPPLSPLPARSPTLTDITEEPAAKRTQMWLAQLGRYRQRSLQEELDRNHDELWEEQIARVKANPVRSPLEPMEIILDGDKSKTASVPAPQTALTTLPVPEQPQPICSVPLMLSALQVRPAVLPKGPSATITRPQEMEQEDENPSAKQQQMMFMMMAMAGGKRKNSEGASSKRDEEEAPPPKKKMTLPLESDIPELPPTPEEERQSRRDQEEEQLEEEKAPEPVRQAPSFLKSLLLDRSAPAVKRPSMEGPPPSLRVIKRPEEAAAAQPTAADILRRRLLGLPDLPATLLPPQKQAKKEDEDKTLRSLMATPPMNLAKKEEQPMPPRKESVSSGKRSYAHTSVLKHLLHRYTESGEQALEQQS